MRDVTIGDQESSLRGGGIWAETSTLSGHHDLQFFFLTADFNEPLVCACSNMYNNY